MSHRHFCDYAGHDWECDGFALRPLAGQTKPSECYCLRHQVPMEEGDHSRCPVELLACPKHRDEQLQRIAIFDRGDLRLTVEAESLFRDRNGTPIVGFCIWCDKNFYSIEEAETHHAGDGRTCPAFQRMKDEDRVQS
jgi:hypothetical protein